MKLKKQMERKLLRSMAQTDAASAVIPNNDVMTRCKKHEVRLHILYWRRKIRSQLYHEKGSRDGLDYGEKSDYISLKKKKKLEIKTFTARAGNVDRNDFSSNGLR